MAEIVWILGAGFSRPLNGPLLSELMRQEVRSTINACFPKDNYPRLYEEAIDHVLKLYAYGRGRTHETGLPGEFIWQDAEQFLDYLDTASTPKEGPAKRRLEQVLKEMLQLNSTVETLRFASRRVVAASCCAFLEGADPSTERWLPYTEWAKRLSKGDAIITFNYDRVVELAAMHVGLDLDVVLRGRNLNATRLYKLHGSVDWQCRRTGSVRKPDGRESEIVEIIRSENPTFALTGPDSELLIASPGPSKTTVPEGYLSSVGKLACDEIRDATGVVFVGYRFPPSDAHARKILVDSLRSNTRPRRKLSFVLGSERTAEVVRMERLLTYVAGAHKPDTTQVEWLPFGAEDLLLMNMGASLRAG